MAGCFRDRPLPLPPQEPTLRFAPSPTGELHLGHAASALINKNIAQKLGGRLLLRIEDIDLGRRRQEFVNGIYDDLKWLGFIWEEPVLQQSERLGIYEDYIIRLRSAGLLYPCFATRKEIQEAAEKNNSPRDPDGAPVYPKLHKHLNEEEVTDRMARGEPYALRIDMEKAIQAAQRIYGQREMAYMAFDSKGIIRPTRIDPAKWGDVVLARKDNGTSYHMACTIDDALQGVTHVIRGKDLEVATDIHRLLQILLQLPSPLYHHHGLIVDQDGRKLSKSANDTSLKYLRENGTTLAELQKKLDALLRSYSDFEL